MPPTVSVIIPCYGQAHFLHDSIRSVLAQTYRPWELIVIDDGSLDDVSAVVRHYPEVRYHRQDNQGLSAARNRGMAESTGEFLVFLDADDRLLPEALDAGVAALSARPGCGFVWGSRRLIDAEGNPLPDVPRGFEGSARYEMLLLENIVGPPVGVMFRRSVLEAVGGFATEQLHSEDYEMYMRIARSYDTWCHQTLVAEYRIHTANMSHNSKGMRTGNLLALDRQERWIGNDVVLRRALRKGRRITHDSYDAWDRMTELSQHSRAKRWPSVAVAATALLWKHPRMFFPVLLRRVRRAFGLGSSALDDRGSQ
ncbi:MAG TPA: glycosyltransferase [Gemmatimonadales bacterium]|nr:glycosyltransferase [Gemmatimonadales bacterium]